MAKKKQTPKQLQILKENAFKPGVSGNPNGRPSGAKNFKNVIRDVLDAVASSSEFHDEDTLRCDILENILNRPVSRREAMVYKQIVKAMRGDTFAFNAVADREEGKPKQTVDNTVRTYESYLDGLPEGEEGET